ncbi:MAG: response regulator [Deltaproteobacteria bacterium]|nr:response regulator [Deltaproteobacteria bacterium]
MRSGFDYQDAHAVAVLVDWLCSPHSISWVKLEADEYMWVDDIAICRSNGQLELHQIKCAMHPHCPKGALTWAKLTAPDREGTALISKLFRSWQNLTEFPISQLVLTTNRQAGLDLRKGMLQTDDAEWCIDVKSLRKHEWWTLLREQLETTGDHELERFLSILRLRLGAPDYPILRDAARRKFCNTLGGSEEDLIRLVDAVRRWSTFKDQPAPDGRIRLEHIQSAVGHIVSLRDDFTKLCQEQVETEIQDFIGTAFRPEQYLERDCEEELAGLINPWALATRRYSFSRAVDEWSEYEQQILEDFRSGNHDAVARFLRFLSSVPQAKHSTRDSNGRIDALIAGMRSETIDHGDQLIRTSRKLKSTAERDLVIFLVEARKNMKGVALTSAPAILRKFESALSSRDRLALYKAAVEYDNYFSLREQLWSRLEQDDSLSPEETYRLHEATAVVARCSEYRQLTKDIVEGLEMQTVVILAEGGRGKTWALCNAAQRLCSDFPIVFLSSRDRRLSRNKTLLEVLADVLSPLRPTWKITADRVRAILRNRLAADEYLSVVIDGLDSLSAPKDAASWLLSLRPEIRTLPVRLIMSCRTAYWYHFRETYQRQPGVRIAESLISNFSDREAQQLAKIAPRLRSLDRKVGSQLLRIPLIVGCCLDLFSSGEWMQETVILSTLPAVLRHYLQHVVQEVSTRTGIDIWWVRHFLCAVFRIILDQRGIAKLQQEESDGGPLALTRGELKKLLSEETGEYHPQIIAEFESCGLIGTRDIRLWVANDVILEFGIAETILERYLERDSRKLLPAFFKDFDMHRDWLPGQIGVMAFVATRLADHGFRLWEYFTDDFPGRTDLINLISLYLPARHVDVDFLGDQLRSNAQQLIARRLQLGNTDRKLLAWLGEPDLFTQRSANCAFNTGNLLNQPLEIKRDLVRAEFYRIHRFRGDSPEKDIPNQLKPEIDFWLRYFPEQIIPLVAEPTAQLAVRYHLADILVHICSDSRLPVELNARIYPAFLRAALRVGVTLQPEERLKILISDDEPAACDVIEEMISLAVQMVGVKSAVSIEVVPGGKGDETLDRILREHFSLLLIDIEKPGLSGPEVIRQFRDSESGHADDDLSILILTGYSDGMSFANSGADGFVSKPIELENLATLVWGYGGRDRIHLGALHSKLLAVLTKESRE